MILGAARVELRVHGSRSLKEKRGVVRSITRRVRNRFNVAISEVEGQDTWQCAVLGIATTGNDAEVVRGRLEKTIDFVEGLMLAEVVDQEIEVVATPLAAYEGGHWEPPDDAEDEEEGP